MKRARRTLAVAVVAVAVASCIPEDEAAPPRKSSVAVELRGEPRGPFALADGWSFTFDRFHLMMPSLSIMSPPPRTDGTTEGPGAYCSSRDADGDDVYLRLFDLARPEPSVLRLNGLDRDICRLRSLSIQPAGNWTSSYTPDIARGAGVTAEDVARFLADGEVVAWLEGRARREAREVRLALAVRRNLAQDTREIDTCSATSALSNPAQSGGPDVVLVPGQRTTIHGTAHLEVVFSDPSAGGELRFDAIAAADVNGDGVVTWDELEPRPLPGSSPIATGSSSSGPLPSGPPPSGPPSSTFPPTGATTRGSVLRQQLRRLVTYDVPCQKKL